MTKGSYLKHVGLQISKRRKSLGFTQKDVIDKLSKIISDGENPMTEKQLSRIENGTSGTTIEKYNLIFRALNKSPDYFMCGIADDVIDDAETIISDIEICLKDCDLNYLKDILVIAKAFAENSNHK